MCFSAIAIGGLTALGYWLARKAWRNMLLPPSPPPRSNRMEEENIKAAEGYYRVLPQVRPVRYRRGKDPEEDYELER